MQDFLGKIFLDFSWQTSFMGVGIELIIIGILIFLYNNFPKNSVLVFFEMAFETVYDFFEELLGKEEKTWLKTYATILFFIIIISNLMGVFLEFLLPIFGLDLKENALHHLIGTPTADINFNIAMALVGVTIVIVEQFKSLGMFSFLHEYVPILGKGYIPYEKGTMKNGILDMGVLAIVKILDIIISLFLGVLEIVGIGAKIISLSFRLFGNITSGGVLLFMLFGGITALSQSLIGLDFPIIAPLIVYMQEILVSFIQAFVFSLLIVIFVKVAKMH